MSKIDELLKNEKVEWKKLGKVCVIKTGQIISKNIIARNKGPYPVINSGREPLGYVNEWNTENDPIGVTTRGAGVGLITYQEGKYYRGNLNYSVTIKDKKKINQRFLYHLLIHLQKEIHQLCTFNGIPALNSSELKELEIPIPPLETQEKIVKTLDKFTNYVTELQAELQARTKQYEYYRDMVLSEEYLKNISDTMYSIQNIGFELNYKTLGEIGIFTRGNGLQKNDFISRGNPVIHYGQIYTKYNFETNKTISFVNDDIFRKLRKAKPNDLLIATTSENIKDVGKCVVWNGNEEVGFSGDMYSYSTNENSKYIAYYFKTIEFQKQKEKKVTGTKLIRIHGDDMSKFIVPLPPIEIQNKVVQILDKFQTLLSDTKGLLPQEIEKRQKQYEYYREKLLTFVEKCDSKQASKQASKQVANNYFVLLKEAAEIVGAKIFSNVHKTSLKTIAKYSIQRVSAGALNEKNYVGVENLLKDKVGKVDSSYVPKTGSLIAFKKGDILIGNIRPYLRKIWIADIDGGTNGDVLVISIKENFENKIVPRFLYQILANESFFEYDIKFSKGAKMPRGDKKKIMEYEFLLPSIPVQEYVVSILDKMNNIINDIHMGLPKEIEQRQKQYKYYREKLLDFKK